MTAQEMLSDGLLTVHQTCKKLGITRQTVYAYMRKGKLPSVKVLDNWRVPVRAVNEILAGLKMGYWQ
jgi:excisionase family DNA binding protein